MNINNNVGWNAATYIQQIQRYERYIKIWMKKSLII